MNQKLFTDPLNEYSLVKNTVFDYIMPTLSGDAWKALCVIIRQTCSIGRPSDETIWVNLTEFMQNAGIPDRTDIERALQECVYAGYMIAHPHNQTRAQASYALNSQYELPTATAEPAPSTKRPAPKSAPQPSAKPTLQTAPAIRLPDEKQAAYEALSQFGQTMGVAFNAQLVQRAVMDNPVDAVDAWIKLGHGLTHLDNAARFQMVLERLLAGVPPMPLSMLAPDESTAAPRSTAVPAPPSTAQAEKLWDATLKSLRSQMRSSLFKWLKPTQAVDLHNNTLRVSAPNARTKGWLETGQVADKITQTFQEVSGGMTLVFVVKS